VLNLADILELVDDSLDEGTFAQKQAICQGQKNMAHVLAQFGDEAQSLGDQELLGEGLRDVAFIAEEATEKPVNQAMHRTTVVGVARSEAEGQQLGAIVDDEVELEPVEPPDRRLAAACVDTKDPVLLDACRMADGEGGGVDEAQTGTLPLLGVQVDGERHEVAWHEFHEARVAHQVWKLLAQRQLHMLGIEPFAGPIAGLLQEDEDGQDLCWVQSGSAATVSLPRGEQLALPQRFKVLPEGIHRAIQIEYTHAQYLQFGLMGPRKPHHNAVGGIWLIPNWILLAN